MNGAAAGLPVLLAGLLVKTTAVLGLALAAAKASSARPAAFRHFLISAALIGLLFLPLLTLAPVGWRSDLVPAWLGPPSPVSAPPHAEKAGAGMGDAGMFAGRIAEPVPADHRPEGTSLFIGAAHFASAANAAAAGDDVARSAAPLSAAGHLSAGTEAKTRPSAAAAALGPALAVLWAAGFAGLVLRLLIGLAGAGRLTAEGTLLGDPSWRVLIERFLALVSLRRPVRLKSHPAVLVPLTWGWLKPVVLLPDGADGWSEDERSSALFHELSHIKRADFLVMLLVRMSLALFWWNPLCWVVYRELLKEQEIACDELVLRAGIRPSTYAASLLAFRRAAGFRWNPSAALIGMLGRSSFQDRLAAILKQKLTFREVRMKTKIMVALVLVLAVAFIGSARPAAGRETGEAKTVLVPTEIAAPASVEPAFMGIADPQTQTQAEKAKEAEKAKQVEKTVVIKPVVAEGQPLEIVITEGDQVKKLRIDKPLTITKEKDGGAIILTIEGGEAQVLKGVPLRIEVKGGALTVIKEGQPLEIGEDTHLDIAKEIVTEGGVIYLKPRPEGAQSFTLVKKGETDKDGVKVIVETHKEGEPTIVWSTKEGEKGEHFKIVKSESGEPLTMAWTAAPNKGFAIAEARDKEMLEKVKALQEQVQAIKAKKMDISALEESLKKLEQELQEEAKKLEHITVAVAGEPVEVTVAGEPAHYAVAKKIVGEEMEHGVAYIVVDKGKDVEAEKTTARVKVATEDKGAITIVYSRNGLTREAYEKGLAGLKAKLPEGYKVVETNYDKDGASMTVKIAPPEGKAVDKDLVKKLVETLGAEIKK